MNNELRELYRDIETQSRAVAKALEAQHQAFVTNILVGWIVVAIVCGLFGGVIGRQKGQGSLGFWLGFFLGPIGVLVAVLLPTMSSSPPPLPHTDRGPSLDEWQAPPASDAWSGFPPVSPLYTPPPPPPKNGGDIADLYRARSL